MSETEERLVSDNTAENAGERDRGRKKKRQLHEERRRPRESFSIKEGGERRRKKERKGRNEGREDEKNDLSLSLSLSLSPPLPFSLSFTLAYVRGEGQARLEGRGALQEARRNWSHSAGQETARTAETEERPGQKRITRVITTLINK